MSADLLFGEACKLVTVYVHFTAPVTEDITISFISAEDSLHNTVISKETITAASDYVFAASGDLALNEKDIIRVAVTNATGVGTAYVTAKAEK